VNTANDCNEVAYWRVSPAHIDGHATQRLMVVLRTGGCEYARRADGGCTVCGFLDNAVDGISETAIQYQLDTLLSRVDLAGVGEFDLLTLGSFLNDREVSPSLRASLLHRVAKLPSIQRVSFESRAEYITLDNLRACKAALGDKAGELGIGLESADDHIRNEIIRKGLEKEAFVDVVRKVGQAGLRLLVYLLIKPPSLTEQQAIDDAVASARYVFRVAGEHGVKARVAFEPVFICPNTQLDELFTKSEYRLVNLWSVVDVIQRVHMLGPIFVGLSDENLSMDRMPGSCDKCYQRIIEAVEGFNGSQDIRAIAALDCDCRARYVDSVRRGSR
jgi:archaeosine synthase beta-subunit